MVYTVCIKRERVNVLSNSSTYGEESIHVLKGAERVSKRPSVMFGSDDLNGAFNAVKEIIGNSLDEAQAGYGNRIEVNWYGHGEVSVQDFGRGVPMDWNKAENRYNWDLVYNELYAGGKYNESQYENSIGLNGLGGAATQYASEWFRVESRRDGFIFRMNFEGGSPVGELEKIKDTEVPQKTGTTVHWKLSNMVFESVDFNASTFKKYCSEKANLRESSSRNTEPLTIVFTDKVADKTYTYVGKELKDYLTSLLPSGSVVDVFSKRNVTEGKDSRNREYKAKVEIALVISEELSSPKRMYYHNTAEMNEGKHISAVENALGKFFEDEVKRKGFHASRSDYNGYVSVIVATYANNGVMSYANQTKTGVSNPFIYDLVYSTLLDMLEEALAMQKESVVNLINAVVEKAQLRQQVEDYRKTQRTKSRLMNGSKPEKFADCRSKDSSKRELYIVEGDSALGAVKLARDGTFQAVIPVRGKTLNCLKAPLDYILKKSAVIRDLVKAVGVGVDLGDGEFDIAKLPWSKVIICTDADVDGFQIRVMLYTMFYRLMPQLLRDGYVYIAETPLFEIITTSGTYFAYSPAEKDEMIETLSKQGISVKRINRSKGLGENDASMMSLTTMKPESRRLVQLKVNTNDKFVRDISNMLFGADPTNERKTCIMEMLNASLDEEASILESLSKDDELLNTGSELESESDSDDTSGLLQDDVLVNVDKETEDSYYTV